MKTNQYRILSGKFKGKSVDLPIVEETRPTKSIVRESFISSVRAELPYIHLVEMFGGSGSVGIDALSNHLKFATFLEMNTDVAKVLRRNLSNLEANNNQVIVGNSFETIKPLIEKIVSKNEEVIFYIDPPFDIRENQENIYEKVINLFELFPQDLTLLIAIEHISTFSFKEEIGSFIQKKKKKFGNTTLSYFIPKES
jgi:16S rRNA (guanine966-N2)-methyltransferase